jgi:hypothetical protein
MKKHGKKALSLFLSLVMVVTMVPVIGMVFTPKAKAYDNYSKPYSTEYYYPSGTKFVKNIALYYSSKSSNAQNGAKNGVGYSSGSLFSGSYHAYHDSSHNAAFIDQDMNEGAGGDYVYVSYNLTTDPAAANACKSVGVETNEFGSYNSSGSVSVTVSGKTVTWYRCNNGNNSTYNPKLTSDGAVDLNKGAGGKDMTFYATYDRNYGPAIDCFTVISHTDSESISATSGNSYFNGAGWYRCVAINSPSNYPDLNRGAGGDDLYAYYHTPCSVVNSDTLRAEYAQKKYIYEHGGSGISALTTALNTASSILTDLNDGYTTSNQTAIDNAVNALRNAIPTLTLNQDATPSLSAGGSVWYKYTPPSTGSYVFLTHASFDTKYELYTGTSTSSSDSMDDGDSTIISMLGMANYQVYDEISLSAGTTYYFRAYAYSSSNSGSLPIRIATPVKVTFNATGGTNKDYNLPKSYPSLKLNNTGVSRSDHTLVGWSTSNSSNEALYKLKTETITVPDSATTYYALWSPNSPTALAVNTDYTATISAGGQIVYYSFTPAENGKYLIYGKGSTDSYVIRYNPDTYLSAGTYLDVQDDASNSSNGNTTGYDFGIGGNQFFMLRELTAGQTYLFGVKFYGSGTGSIPFRFEKVYKVSYDSKGGGGTPAAQDKFYGKDLVLSSTEPTPPAAYASYQFLHWSTDANSNAEAYVAGATYRENANVTLYAVYGKEATATFYWYNASGTRTSQSKTAKNYLGDTQFTFDVPSVPGTITVDGSTYNFKGWAQNTTALTPENFGDSAAGITVNNNSSYSYSFYAIYEKAATLSYDSNGGNATPASHSLTWTLNCGDSTTVAANTNDVYTFTINPGNTVMSRNYSSAFLGWNTSKTDAQNNERATYKDGTVTGSSLPATIKLRKNTTLYAVYYDFRFKVQFINQNGDVIEEHNDVRYNTTVAAPAGMHTDPADPSHTDSLNHYVFDHWEYEDGNEYKSADKFTKLENNYIYRIFAKYLGHSHIWGEPYDVHGVTTCTSGKQYKVRCTICHQVFQKEEIPEGHDYVLVGEIAPTCTKAGSYGKLICRNCSTVDPNQTAIINGVETVITNENRTIPALGHNYGVYDAETETWIYLRKDAETGEIILTDPDTGEFLVEPETVEATCTNSGYYFYTCARCDSVYRVGNIPALGHDWDMGEETPATCTEPGHSAYKICNTCGLVITEKVVYPASGHEYELVEETPSTCIEKGHDAYYVCNCCGKYFDTDDDRTELTDITVKDKADFGGHVYELVEETPSTCIEKGHYAYYECSVCGKYFDTDDDKTEIADITSKDKTEFGDHDYQPVNQEPSCTQNGYTNSYVCTLCETVDPERPGDVVVAPGHDWGEWTVTSEPACGVAGEKKRICGVCGEEETEEIAALEHIQGEYIDPVSATCTEDGSTEGYYCTECDGYYLEPTVIPALGHDMETIDGTAPTCTEPGSPDYYYCTRCEKYFADAAGNTELEMMVDEEENPVPVEGQLEPIEELGHDWTDYILAKAPTCTDAGKETRRCMRCGKVGTSVVPASGHSYTLVNAKAATCLEDGNDDYYECAVCGKYFVLGEPDEDENDTYVEVSYEDDIVIAALGHDMPAEPTDTQDATCAAEGYEEYECNRCHRTERVILPKTNEHPEEAIEEFGAKEATCTAVGYSAGTYCTLCNTVLTQPAATPKAAHNPGERENVLSATCEDTGYTGDVYCTECGQLIESGVRTEAKGHVLGALTEVKAATCTEKGKKERKCTVEGCSYSVSYETPVLGHQIVIDKGTPATCTSSGFSDGQHCARCDECTVLKTVIEAYGHKYDEGVVVEPTCTQIGYTLYTCTNCGETKKDDYTDKAAHTVGTPATCTDAAVCAVCGRSYGSALGHDYELDEIIPGTCIAREKKVYKCANCGDTYTEEFDFGTHEIDETTVVLIEATCTQDGSVSWTCKHCGATVNEVLAARGHDYENGICTRCGEPEPTDTPDTPDTPSQPSGSEKCSKCGLNHNGRTGLWRENGFFCRIIAFFRNLFNFGK